MPEVILDMKEPKELSEDELVLLRKHIVKYLFIYPMNTQPQISEQNFFLCYFHYHPATQHSNTIRNCPMIEDKRMIDGLMLPQYEAQN